MPIYKPLIICEFEKYIYQKLKQKQILAVIIKGKTKTKK